MRASLRNQIRSAEIEAILQTVLESHRKLFLKRQNLALNRHEPVAPYIGTHLAVLIRQSRPNQKLVMFIDGINSTDSHMEAKVVCAVDGNKIRWVALTTEKQKLPSCFAFPLDHSVFPCWHRKAMIYEKVWLNENFNFFRARILTVAWEEQYEGVVFPMHIQADVDRVLLDAQEQVLPGSSINISVAILRNGCVHGRRQGQKL